MVVTYYLVEKGNLHIPSQCHIFLSCAEKCCLETEILWWNEVGEFPQIQKIVIDFLNVMRLLWGFWTHSYQILERRRKKGRKIGQFGKRIGLSASPWRWQILPVLRKGQSARLAQSLKCTAVPSEVWGGWIVQSNHFYLLVFRLWRDSAFWNG